MPISKLSPQGFRKLAERWWLGAWFLVGWLTTRDAPAWRGSRTLYAVGVLFGLGVLAGPLWTLLLATKIASGRSDKKPWFAFALSVISTSAFVTTGAAASAREMTWRPEVGIFRSDVQGLETATVAACEGRANMPLVRGRPVLSGACNRADVLLVVGRLSPVRSKAITYPRYWGIGRGEKLTDLVPGSRDIFRATARYRDLGDGWWYWEGEYGLPSERLPFLPPAVKVFGTPPVTYETLESTLP